MPNFKYAVTLLLMLLFTLITQKTVSAQSEELKLEVGVQFSVLGKNTGFSIDNNPSIGGGARLTYNLNRYLALEGELNYFPSAGSDSARRLQCQFGVKSGLRFDRFGVFGKVRPGFISTRNSIPLFCAQPVCPPDQVCLPSFPLSCPTLNFSDTGFSLDVGGVLEFYPAKRAIVRFDVGDTISQRREFPALFARKVATHSAQLSAGVGFRF